MKVTYIDHSCFSVEDTDKVFLFDYYKGTIPEFDKTKQIYVFSSHAHPDHFQKSIFKLGEKYPDIVYILSSDIQTNKKEEEDYYIVKLLPNRTYMLDDLYIKTLASTDEGTAFVVEWGDKSIYHAGDLNWWHWNGETKAYNEAMSADYQREIEKIKGHLFDLAFVPLDGRLEDAYSKGLDYFAANTEAAHIFPMHLWGDYSLCRTFKKEFADKPYIEAIMNVDKENQTWEL